MQRHQATVCSVEQLGGGVSVITFTTEHPEFSYGAGQYISVYFDNALRHAGKAYSLLSAPHESPHVIAVKNIGEFSGRLCAMQPGDTFECSRGYGHLNPYTNRPLVCLTSGVGVAPIWSIAKNELVNNPDRPIQLHCSSRAVSTVPRLRELEEGLERHPNLSITHYITREQSVPAHMRSRRIDITRDLPGVDEQAMYVICGSIDFVRDMYKALIGRGVSQSDISTESFFE